MNFFLASGALIAAYFVTPVAKEGWVLAAPSVFGIPAWEAVVILLSFEACVVTATLWAFPIEWLARFAPKIEKFEHKVRDSRLARRGLGVAIAGVIALPFHTGGGIIGTLAGRTLGLPRLTTFCAVLGGIAFRFLVVLAGYSLYAAIR